jgi:predicted negative regulator of RcsB-dependent stress response
MSQHLDLEEQEQLAELKHFWSRYGNWIAWALIVVLGGFAAWNGYNYWQRSQSAQASVLFDEVDRAASAGDVPRLERSWADMQDKFGTTAYAQHAGLLAAKVFYEKDKLDAAKAALQRVVDRSSDAGLSAVARLRLAGVLVQQKAYDEALTQLSAPFPQSFAALVLDRRADILVLQGKKAEAIAAYQQAQQGLGEQDEYRRLVDVKLTALGVDPLTVTKTEAVKGSKP